MSLKLRSIGLAFVAAGLALTGCSSAADPGNAGGTSPDSPHLVAGKEGPYTVGFANSFAGNAYRTQMILELQEYAANHSDLVKDVIITDANGSVDKQISDINDLLTRDIDILLINAASESALNSAADRAWQQGILVVSFDNAISSEHGIIVNTSQEEFGRVGGEWLAEKLGDGAEIVTLDGQAGSPVSDQRLNGAADVLNAAGIKILAGAATDWDQAMGQQAAADLLAAHPDIDGIYSQGGGPSLGAINAMEQRGDDIVPITGEGYNGFLKKWKELKDSDGFESIAPSNPPYLSAEALRIAIETLQGKDPGQNVVLELPVITQDSLEDYVRMDLPDAFFLPTNLSEETIEKNYR